MQKNIVMYGSGLILVSNYIKVFIPEKRHKRPLSFPFIFGIIVEIFYNMYQSYVIKVCHFQWCIEDSRITNLF